jgi:hypothetical protein
LFERSSGRPWRKPAPRQGLFFNIGDPLSGRHAGRSRGANKVIAIDGLQSSSIADIRDAIIATGLPTFN